MNRPGRKAARVAPVALAWLVAAGAVVGVAPPAGAGGTLPSGPVADEPSLAAGTRPAPEALLGVLERHEQWFVAHRRQIRRGANPFNFQTALRFDGRAYLRGVDLSGPGLWDEVRRLAGKAPPAPLGERRTQNTGGWWPRLGWADLTGANLRNASLGGAELIHTVFVDADLRGADLNRAYLDKADLRGADLRGADLRGAYLMGARLQGARLEGARLDGAFLGRAQLEGADLTGVDLSHVDLGGRGPGAGPAPETGSEASGPAPAAP